MQGSPQERYNTRMPHDIKAIIFDFGNVLLEWNLWRVYRRYLASEEAMQAFFREINFTDWNAQFDQGRSFQEGVAILTKQFPHHARLIHAYRDRWDDSIGGAIAGSVDILKRLKRRGYPLYGLSNWSAETFPRTRAKYDFFDLFDDMVVSGFVGVIKPNPAIYELALKKVGRPASECLFIDDSPANINQAKRLGFAAIHFTTPERLEDELTQIGIL